MEKSAIVPLVMVLAALPLNINGEETMTAAEEQTLISGISDIQDNTTMETKELQSERDAATVLDKDLNDDTYFHQLMQFSMPDEESVKNLACADLAIIFAQKIVEKSGLSLQTLRGNKTLMGLWLEWYRRKCPEPPTPLCDSTQRYANSDGSCNNLQHPLWGKVDRNELRFVGADYDDDIATPRQHGTDGSLLPDPRVISNALFAAKEDTILSDQLPVMHMAWGQFMIHDIVKTPLTPGVNGSDLDCCGNNGNSPDCFPLTMPQNDPFFKSKSCMQFVRSLPGEPEDGLPGIREQINEVTSYLDGSVVYGSSDEQSCKLREHEGGLMKVKDSKLLPKGSDASCILSSNTEWCQKAGDGRANDVPNLCTLHTLFVRYHNDVAGRLADVNPHWEDEQLFQETRKIITAILQHITYNEYLPLHLGSAIMTKYGLLSKESGFDDVYDPTVDATVKNSFAAAAHRFGHSQVPNHQAMMNFRFRPHFQTAVENTFNRPTLCLGNSGKNIADLLRWMSTDKSAEVDNQFENGIRNKLFIDHEGQSFDLPSLNIHRGRDHGIPGYTTFRKLCKLAPVNITENKDWDLPDHSLEITEILRSLYSNPDDIDLYAGGISENSVPDGKLGPTFACIVGQQFRDFKRGDRFWYENNNQISGFTLDQVNEIKKIKLSQMICIGGGVSPIQENVFQLPTSKNPRKGCNGFPIFDLGKWQADIP